jgi:hypothetical protein
MKRIKLMLYTTFIIALGSACSASASKFASGSPPTCSKKGLTIATILTIVPEQTSQSEIEGLLGDADGIEEPLLSEWTWIYICDESSDTTVYVTFNTSKRPFKVSKLNYYNPKIDVAELISQLGSPELVYKENPEIQNGGSRKYTFAYPSLGLFASTISTSVPTPSDEVIEIHKKVPENEQQFLTNLGKQTDVEIIEWSFEEPK